MSISKTAVSRPTTILIIFCVAVALCTYSTMSLPLDLFPNIEIPYLIVSTTYKNAGPAEIEENVTRLIESAVTSVSGIKKVSSTSSTGSSIVAIELNYGTNLDTAANEMRDRIDLVKRALPKDADSPLIIRIDPSMMPIMFFMLTGNRTPEELRKYAEDIVAPRLEQVDGVASVFVSGGRKRAIRVEIPIDRLEAYGITATQIAQAIAAQNIQASGGSISEGDYDFTINTSGDFKSIEDIRNTVISYKSDSSAGAGQPPVLRSIKLRDIANVYDGYEKLNSLAFLDGQPGVRFGVQKQSGKNSVQTAQKARKKIEEIEKALPNDVKITETINTTNIIQNSINEVTGSAVQGALLAVLVLFLFLRSWKSTVIIGLTIPISLVITLGLVYFAGFTLNIMTLAGLALGVGMLVDNSIVILENIYSYRERGAKPTVAAVLGSQEMVMAIISSTLTTICVFLPLILYKNKLGVLGQVFEGLTFTVVFSLICSLIVAIVLVPVLASKYLKIENVKKRKLTGFVGWLDSKLGIIFDKLDEWYASAVRKVVRNRKKTVFGIFVLFVLSCVALPFLGFVYMPTQEADSVTINIKAPLGTRIEVTEVIAQQLASFAQQEVTDYEFITISIGTSGMIGGESSSNTASVEIKLAPYATRIEREESIKSKMREHFNEFPGTTFSFGSNSNGFGGGTGGIDVIVKSDDLNLARITSNAILDLMKTKGTEFVSEPESDLIDGLPQVQITIDREKLYNLGLSIYAVSNELNANINGVIATKFREKGKETDVLVSLSEADRSHLTNLEKIFVLNSAGKKIPFSSFAHYAESVSPLSIKRENQTRIVHVKATPLKELSLPFVQNNIEQLIEKNIPRDEEVFISYGGDIKDTRENGIQFVIIALMAVLLVFAVMASLFESFLDPLIVIFTIPLSLVGIVFIYFITGTQLNLITAVGFLILVGIIVNNGIVLVDYTNLLRKRGLALEEACVQAGKSRLRPILMTTLTTVLALIPMAFFPGEGSEMVQPIGLTVFGGLTFGTIMTLFLMPTLYYIFNSKRDRRKAKKRAKILAQEGVHL